MILTLCMTCRKVLGIKPGGDGVSHGICPECAADMVRGEPDAGPLALQAESLPDVRGQRQLRGLGERGEACGVGGSDADADERGLSEPGGFRVHGVNVARVESDCQTDA